MERTSFIQSLDGLITYSRRGIQEYQALGVNLKRIIVVQEVNVESMVDVFVNAITRVVSMTPSPR